MNTNRTSSEVELLWDGKRDVPEDMEIRVEDDIVISDSVKILSGASVTVAEGVSVQITKEAELTIEENASLDLLEGSSLTVNGALINHWTVICLLQKMKTARPLQQQ